MNRQLKYEAKLSEELENITESFSFESENSWAKTNIKKEFITENTSTECCIVQKSSINTMSATIKIEIKEEEKIIKNEKPENSL